jgi:hypothetical protein
MRKCPSLPRRNAPPCPAVDGRGVRIERIADSKLREVSSSGLSRRKWTGGMRRGGERGRASGVRPAFACRTARPLLPPAPAP